MQADLHLFCQYIGDRPYVIARRIAAGLALLWAAGSDDVAGVITTGRAQVGLQPPHIFADPEDAAFDLGQLIARISPRPLAFVSRPTRGMLGGTKDETVVLHRLARPPKRLEQVTDLTSELVLTLIGWLRQSQPTRGW